MMGGWSYTFEAGAGAMGAGGVGILGSPAFQVIGFIGSQNVIMRSINYALNRIYQNAIPDPASLIVLYRRGLITPATFYKWMGYYGYTKQNADLVLRAADTLLYTSAIVEAYRRGHLSMVEAQAKLKALGLQEEDANLLLQLGERLYQVAELVAMRRRKMIDENAYFEHMQKLGFPMAKAEAIYNLSEKLIAADDVIRAYRRGLIPEEEFYERMYKLGFSREDADILFNVSLYYPGPNDWIRFAVREVFNSLVVEKYGYDEEFPEDIVEPALKAGVTEEILRYYWRAHWELPSPTQGYEMLHRLHPDVLRILGDKYVSMGLASSREEAISKLGTDLDTLRELLKVADYPRYWRDRLIAISYNPLTRVDLRRIYAMGLISREELIARLREIGYSPQDAELMAEFYDEYKTDLDKLEFDVHVDGFLEGLVSEADFRAYFEAKGWSSDKITRLIELLRAQETIAWHKKTESRILSLAQSLLAQGELSEDDFMDILIAYGIPNLFLEPVSSVISMKRIHSIKKKLIYVYKKAVKEGLITLEEFRSYLEYMGIPEDQIKAEIADILVDMKVRPYSPDQVFTSIPGPPEGVGPE